MDVSVKIEPGPYAVWSSITATLDGVTYTHEQHPLDVRVVGSTVHFQVADGADYGWPGVAAEPEVRHTYMSEAAATIGAYEIVRAWLEQNAHRAPPRTAPVMFSATSSGVKLDLRGDALVVEYAGHRFRATVSDWTLEAR